MSTAVPIVEPAEDPNPSGTTGFPSLDVITDLAIPLDTSIDVSAYINAQFPTEAHLNQNLSSFLARLEEAEAKLDTHLASLVRHHRNDTHPASQAVRETQQSLTSLQSSLATLTAAAEDAQSQIDAALKPAAPIHKALENTAATSAALEALVALDDAVTKLEAAAASPTLDLVATNLTVFETVRSSLALFDQHKSSPLRRVPQLRARAAVATETIRSTTLISFRRHSDTLSTPRANPATLDAAVAHLRTACLVADAMGSDVRAELLGTFIRSRKASFRAAFEMDSAGFTTMEKRFVWLRNDLRKNWARLGGERVDRGWGLVFPQEWDVARRVADGVMREIREWTSRTLDAGADRDVVLMVSALSKTKEFEIELDRRFSVEEGAQSFAGLVSESFGPWMGAYVQQEDEHLAVVLAELVREETWDCGEGTVLRSATELFLLIKKSMRTCASLDIRQPLFSLHRVFRKHLSSYAVILVKHLPGVHGNALADSSEGKEYERKLFAACAIVNTAEYCCTTLEQLEEILRKTVQEAYASDIDLGAEKEKFGTVSAKGIQSLVSLLNEDFESELRQISQGDWSSWAEVGDTSKYVVNIGTKLTRSAKVLSELLSKGHFRFTLEKFAAAFINRYTDHVYKCEQMNNFGAQQILLDVSAVKSLLLGIPASVHASVPGTFVKHVNREMGKIEAMLKVILAPVGASVDTYVALVPNGTAEDFQKVLEIRGLRRADAAPLVLDYSRRIGPAQRLKPSQRGGLQNTACSSSATPDERERDTAGSLALSKSGVQSEQPQTQSAAVDSMKSLFGRLGSSLMESGITDRIDQVSSQFESTTDRLKKEAAARGFRFG